MKRAERLGPRPLGEIMSAEPHRRRWLGLFLGSLLLLAPAAFAGEHHSKPSAAAAPVQGAETASEAQETVTPIEELLLLATDSEVCKTEEEGLSWLESKTHFATNTCISCTSSAQCAAPCGGGTPGFDYSCSLDWWECDPDGRSRVCFCFD